MFSAVNRPGQRQRQGAQGGTTGCRRRSWRTAAAPAPPCGQASSAALRSWKKSRSRSTSPHEQAKHSSGRAPIRRSATPSSTSSRRSCRNSCPQCPAYPFAVSTGQPKRPRSSVVIGMPWYRSTIPVSPSRLATQPVAGFPPAQMARALCAPCARPTGRRTSSLTSLNDYLFAIGQDNFVTVTYGVLDRDRHVWAESRAGHPPTVVRSTDGEALTGL